MTSRAAIGLLVPLVVSLLTAISLAGCGDDSVVVTVAIIVFVLFFQRGIVSGLTAGAVKG